MENAQKHPNKNQSDRIIFDMTQTFDEFIFGSKAVE